jgi:hypothetical protein
MLPHERGIWSDMSGAVELAPKEELAAPKGYHWIEDNWILDQTGPWIDEALGLGKSFDLNQSIYKLISML